MSLRSFHIFFVSLATLMCLFLVFWGFVLANDKTAFDLGLGVLGIIGAILLPIYGVYFYRKARNILL